MPNRQRKPIARYSTRPHFTDGRTFHDPRSRVIPKTGQVLLRGADMTAFRREIFRRASGRCELLNDEGRRCDVFAPWDGWQHGELSHEVHRKRGGSDVETNVVWACFEHHRARHPGPQWTRKAA